MSRVLGGDEALQAQPNPTAAVRPELLASITAYTTSVDGRMAAQTGIMMSSGSLCTSGRQQNPVQALFGRPLQGHVSFIGAPKGQLVQNTDGIPLNIDNHVLT